MGAYLGPLGNLVQFVYWKEKQTRSTSRPVSYRTTIDGTKKATLGPRSLREWQMSASDMDPEQFAPFKELMASGPGPYWFLDPMARVTNVLTPRGSRPGSENSFAYTGGSPVAVNLPGFPPASPAVTVAASTDHWTALNAPVIIGQPATLSAYVHGFGSCTLTAEFQDLDGTVVGSESVTVNTTDSWQRYSVSSSSVPVGASQCRLKIRSTAAFTAALPAVTWTPVMLPYALGVGCSQAVISGYDESFDWADSELNGQRLINFKFTVTEVGDGA